MDLSTLHQHLMRPETYPGERGPVTFRETHVSRLYLTAEHVYKIKKPVDFGFLNFTTPDRRRFYCAEEVRLNSPFCPGTYLGVVEIRHEGDRVSIGGKGELIDYAVRMKRLPEKRMLDVMISAGDPTLPDEVARLGAHLARLHNSSEVRIHAGGRSHLDLTKINWQENLEQTAPYIGQTLTDQAHALVKSYVEKFIDRHPPLLEGREASGFILDGHGDLHAEHICLTDPICIYDCIEFNERFRVGDRLSDLAFLLMDLEHRGRRDLSAILLDAYRAVAGEDRAAPLLLPFYKIYRAWVRGKVESFLSSDSQAPETSREEARQRAIDYFNQALGYLCPPSLVLTCGLMGVGKSSVARVLARALGATLLRSDEERKILSGISPRQRCGSEFNKGIYTPEMSRKTYDQLLAKSTQELNRGLPVVVDASFGREKERESFRRAAEEAGAPFLIVWMTCDEQTTLERLSRRQKEGVDPSDGRPELLAMQAQRFEPPPEGGSRFHIDTRNDLAYNAQRILTRLAKADGDF